MVSQRSRTAKASHTPPRCHSERTLSFRVHIVIPRVARNLITSLWG